MPVHIVNSAMSTPYPSFMSVYGSDPHSIERELADEASQKQTEPPLGQLNINAQRTQHNSHALPYPIYHRGSVTSIATTASSASSPTTTHSSPIFSDPSPSSSPESASSSNPPPSPFRNIMQTIRHVDHGSENGPDQTTQERPPLSIQSHIRSDSPSRNVKNLSLNMNTTVSLRPATSHGAESRTDAFSAPASPLREPLRSARKKPTNLTIRTPGFNQLAFPRALGDVPPTPSSRPTLLTLQTSPSLPSLQTPTTSSSMGLHLSLPTFSAGHSRPGSESSVSSHQSAGVQLPGLKEEDEPRRSFEAPERGYTEGPVQIYDCGVWLYLEPKAEEAKEFDTVINCAKEIKNPFEASSGETDTVMSVWRNNRNSIIEPQTALSELSFKSAWEFQPENTPSTPRPSSLLKNDPEYLHVPWDHNSEILDDLWPLCCVIDERVKVGKRVLIHCQLGVSRSASLVIAYGLYKGYQQNFHSMYQQVKSKSRWVGPNMSLIYQLSDFRVAIEKGTYANGGRPAPPQWFKYSPPDSLSFSNPELSSLNQRPETGPVSDDDAKTPKANPLRSIKLDKALPPVPLFPKDEPKSDAPAVPSSQPALPPKSNATPPTPPKAEPAAKKQSVEPRELPFRKMANYSHPLRIPPHRPRPQNEPNAPMKIHISRPSMDLASQDVPESPSLFSPRATEFLASPFGISNSVGELLISGPRSARSIHSIAPPTPSPGVIGFSHIRAPTMHLDDAPTQPAVPTTIDPRSPPQQGEAKEILRHIDDFL
ncbi:Tyrosine-protein phosphatase pmp1 [Cyphellophora attinorum]|uniref:protein-tyrosine-phosphatase n=1 Tax=Cyphellophora attinorum TaxID=1664694 RepID=A0A0N1P121_9EURO|nr:Tyrosine-protein phosphatase pmp1 [Phialophora attinorum]KPI44473.1 Tyrosine-protein phosphatase pmp1 [Phialophora attinorum]